MARDGYSANVYANKLIIFGGDRNLMAFHDIFLYSLDHAIQESVQ